MKQLYEIEAHLVFYVMAESEKEASDISLRVAKEECDNLMKHNLDVNRAKKFYCADWEDAEPYNSDDSRTVKEIVEAEKAIC